MGRRKPVTDPLAEPWRVLTDSDKQWVNTQLGYCGLSYPPPSSGPEIVKPIIERVTKVPSNREIAMRVQETRERQEKQDRVRRERDRRQWKVEAEEQLRRQVETSMYANIIASSPIRKRGSHTAHVLDAYSRGIAGVYRAANGGDKPKVVNPANDPFYDQL